MNDDYFGFIVIDKPSGPTSFSVSSFVREKLKLKKTSHLGTLDPKVTGVLPIALGRTCKLAGYLLGNDKEYVGVLSCHTEQKLEELQKLIDMHFTGKIIQTPPHKSAVKRAPRERTVYSWKLLEASENNKDFLFSCSVEGGTYIRKLCSDLGEMIGGAHMAELRRTKAGLFDESKMYTLDVFDSATKESIKEMIVPAEEVIRKKFVCVDVEKRVVHSLYTGKPLYLGDVVSVEDFKKIQSGDVFAVFCEGVFIEIARKVADHEMVAKPEYVYN